MDLLPNDFSEFRSKEYWDKFFRKRDKIPFEWYGDWTELKSLIQKWCVPGDNGDDILIVGCGNSELSAEMYDHGFTKLTNIDFSRVCIVEMLKKHVRSRPKMRWSVMDMTNMQLEDGSFDVIVDKGGLDALMGEEGEESTLSGGKLLSEVSRVLRRGGGRYFCVSLAQDHVLQLLLETFREGWEVAINRIQQADDPCTLKPFLIVAKKCAPVDGTDVTARPVELSFDRGALDGISEGQLSDMLAVVDAENARRKRQVAELTSNGGSVTNGHCLAESNGSHSPSGTSAVTDASEGLHANGALDFTRVYPGRRVLVLLGAEESPRYTAVVMDAPLREGRAAHACAVFLVPQGREHEWLFSSSEGQWQVADSAKATRLIMVILNRGHGFGSTSEVQEELSPMIMELAHKASRDSGVAIPYMTTNDGIGRRTILEETESPLTGPMLVEDIELASEAGRGGGKAHKPTVLRRLVFRRNPNLIQSEASVVTPKEKGREQGKGKKGKKGGKKEKAGAGTAVEASEGARDLSSVNGEGCSRAVVDHSYLASEYHAAMVSGLALLAPVLEKKKLAEERVNVLVIGLGGGALPMFLHNHFPFHIKVVELDGSVAVVAKRHFGFVEDDRMQLQIGDGIAAVADLARSVEALDDGARKPASPSSADRTKRDDSECSENRALPGHLDSPEDIQVAADEEARQAPTSLGRETEAHTEDASFVRETPLVDDLAEAGLRASSGCSGGASGTSAEGGLRRSERRKGGRGKEDGAHDGALRDSTGESMTSREGEGLADGVGEEEEKCERKGGHDERLDILIVDADSENPSLGMSCPPACFLEESFLRLARRVVTDDGILVINVVSRAVAPYTAAILSLEQLFEEVYELDVDEDVNKVLFALPSKSQACKMTGGHLGAAAKVAALAAEFSSWGRGPSLVNIAAGLRLLSGKSRAEDRAKVRDSSQKGTGTSAGSSATCPNADDACPEGVNGKKGGEARKSAKGGKKGRKIKGA